MPVVLRGLAASDRDAWQSLWTDYLTFYQSTVSDAVYDTTFARLLGDDPQDFTCLLACVDDVPVGLTHFLFHRHNWRIDNVCYLQDLYASPHVRGRGVGRALIEGVYAAADAAGSPNVYWLTQQSNLTAQQLYDRIALQTEFIKYQRPAA